MREFRYTEIATITISRNVRLEADDNMEALSVCNETMMSGFNPNTDEVIDYKTEQWNLEEIKNESIK